MLSGKEILGYAVAAYGLFYFFKRNKSENTGTGNMSVPTVLPTGDESDNGSDQSQYDFMVPEIETPAQQDIVVTPEIIFYDVNAYNWRGKIIWHIRNNSSSRTYNIVAVRSTLAIMGYVCCWLPGNRDVVRKLAPGQSTTIDATVVDKKVFLKGDYTAKNTVHDYLNENFQKPNSILMANIDLDVRSGNNQMRELVSYENVQGNVTLDGKVYYPGYYGEYYAGDWEWDDEKGFRND